MLDVDNTGNKMRAKKSNDELKRVSEHLCYEIWMLNQTAKIGSPDNPIINNCFIESFGIHARCVCNFLFNTSGRKNYVLAIDFFDRPGEWRQYIKQKRSVLNMINRRVSEELVHLTYTRTRIKPEEKEWKRARILRKVNALFKDFLERVPRERLCDSLTLLERKNLK